jgi:hypothetical protein
MPEITITIPQIDPAMFDALEAAQTQAHESELAAVRAIREKFAAAAKHGQKIKTAHYDCNDTSNRVYINEEALYRVDRKLVKGLLIVDGFTHTERGNGGENVGTRLWLTAAGWVEQKRTGAWSRYSGSADWWCAGAKTAYMSDNDSDWDTGYGGGNTKPLTDEQAAEYKLAAILKGLDKAVAESKDRVPKRIAKLQEQIAVAQGVAAALEVAAK